MTEVEKILKDMPSVKIGLDDFYGRQTVINVLKQLIDDDWLPFTPNMGPVFDKAADNNCQCKFDDGTICRYNDSFPLSVLTHFKVPKE